MAEREYRFMDKSAWGDGPWTGEADKLQWIDPETDLDCLIVRNRLGALCGYVGVPPGHPWHGTKDYMELDVDVHGGLTYAEGCQEGASEEKGICHVPAPDRADDVLWIGFDCSHYCDRVPGMEAREREQGYPLSYEPTAAYRDLSYVKREVASLARQVRDAA